MIPLIAVHLFVFYFGIMGDVTPPVGLATFAAAAISGEDPIETGIQGVGLALRTAILPFVCIFNPAAAADRRAMAGGRRSGRRCATVASLMFAAATMGWFRTKAAGGKSCCC